MLVRAILNVFFISFSVNPVVVFATCDSSLQRFNGPHAAVNQLGGIKRGARALIGQTQRMIDMISSNERELARIGRF